MQRLLEAGASRLDESSQTAGKAPDLTADLVNTASKTGGYPDTAGVYQLEDDEGKMVALNLPDGRTQSITKLEGKEIEETLLPDTQGQLLRAKNNEADSSLLQEIWRPFLIAMLLFLLAEAILTLNKKPSAKTSPPAKKSAA